MATGYTYKVSEGQVTELSDFVLQCARAFGACMHQRDSDSNELPKPREPYQSQKEYDKEIAKLTEEIDKWKNYTTDEIFEIIKKDHIKNLKYNDKQLKLNRKKIARYHEMLYKVKNWQPPSGEHQGLKEFAIDQLQSSIKFDDCSDYYEKEIENLNNNSPETIDLESYRKEEIEMIKSDIIRKKENRQKELKSIESTNLWIEQLYESLK